MFDTLDWRLIRSRAAALVCLRFSVGEPQGIRAALNRQILECLQVGKDGIRVSGVFRHLGRPTANIL